MIFFISSGILKTVGETDDSREGAGDRTFSDHGEPLYPAVICPTGTGKITGEREESNDGEFLLRIYCLAVPYP